MKYRPFSTSSGVFKFYLGYFASVVGIQYFYIEDQKKQMMQDAEKIKN